jgi:hypothetical protein
MGVFDDILGSDDEKEEELELDKNFEPTFDDELKKLLDKVFDDITKEEKTKKINKWYPKRVISEYYENRNKNNKKSKRTKITGSDTVVTRS